MTFDDASVRDVLAGLPIRIGHVFRPYAEHTPGQRALVSPEGRLTYGELAELVSGTARSLLSLGVRPGDRMTIIGENCLSLAVLVLAASEIDAWSVVVHPRLAAREIDQILDHSNSRIAFYDARPAAMAEMHARRHGAKAPGLGELKHIVVGDLRRDAKPEPTHASSDWQAGTLIYTSGTTGLPKGVMLSDRNLLFGAASVVENRMMTAADHVYGMTATAHMAGLSRKSSG
jgi:long-chain acyl-CoA synthetase